jgi:GNAT superfamily N-acetyltransferase
MSLYTIKNLSKQSSIKFTNVVYNNFIHIAKYPELNHTKEEITRLLTNPKSKICLIMVNNKIGAYLIGEQMELADGRRVFYISYIFTSVKFRNRGYASRLINYINQLTKKFNLDGIMLTCDTENQELYNFYQNKKFMPDVALRRYTQYDVLYRQTS